MDIRYKGKLSLEKVSATIKLDHEKASVQSEFHLLNPSTSRLQLKLEATRPTIKALSSRLPTVARRVAPVRGRRATPRLATGRAALPSVSKSTMAEFSARQRRVLDLDYDEPIGGDRIKSYMFTPTLSANKLPILNKVAEYRVKIQLPKEAKRIITSSVPISSKKTADGLLCEIRQNKVYPLPVTIKWTERDEDVVVRKSARRLRNNQVRVTITLINRGDKAARGMEVVDGYSAMDAAPVSGTGLKINTYNDKDPRLEFRRKVSLAAKKRTTLRYIIQAKDVHLQIPSSVVSIGDSIVAISPVGDIFAFPPPPPPPNAAFVLPAGFGFDYKHGGDHHLNEHGMWCTGQNYDEGRQKLSWNTGCIFADKNFDDDYRWTAHHQILRFNPGYAHHESTPWLAKTGNTTTHTDYFQHDSLKQFTHAVVLLRGWHFDFTSKDHHINKMSIKLETTGFNKSTGRVNWRTQVSYADKNFDDNYRYRYYYTILAFNGDYLVASYSGTDLGGSAAHMGQVTNNRLKNYSNAMVIPMGWSFDYKSKDHHINENNFNIQNVKYTPASGKVTWSTHLNYSDKNFDDDYYWRYYVLIIATNDGDSREYNKGPYTDDGGLDSQSYQVYLNRLFRPITWTNGVRDGNETGVDCGGSSPARDLRCLRNSVDPGNASHAKYFNLKKQDELNVVRTFATVALLEYAQSQGQNFDTFYSGIETADRYIEAVAWYVDQHMEWVKDGGSWSGKQTALRTLTQSGHRGSKDFAGDCEDHAILRAALLRSLGLRHTCVFCADHHNSKDQGQKQECGGGKKKSGGHTYNVVVYQGKYRILDYGPMRARYWANQQCWDQHATDNIWNDHTGKHWSRKDVSPYDSSHPLVNYPGNPVSPGGNWDWRTYYNDITP